MSSVPLNAPLPAEEALDFREFLRVVLKHPRLILAVAAAVLALGLTYALAVPKTWQAQVTIKIPDSKALDPLKGLALFAGGSDPIETYLEVARSRNVAGRAARAVSLTAQPEYAGAADFGSAVAALRLRVSVSTVKLSNVLMVQVQARDPRLAAALADAWAQAFIDANLDLSRSGARSRRQFIEEQLVEVKDRLVQGEDVLRRFSESQHRLSGLNGAAGAAAGGQLDPILSLYTRVTNLEIERATLAEHYNPEHPRRQAVEAQLREARSQLNSELDRLPKTELAFTRLSRQVKVDEAVYNLLLEKLQEARLAQNVDDSGIVVVDSAEIPSLPVAPHKGRLLAFSLLAGLLGGLASAWAVERMRDQVGGEEDLARLTGLAVLGLIPDWRSETALLGSVARHDPSYLVSAGRFQHSFYAESFKQLRTNLSYSELGQGLKALAVLSPSSEEGKTLANANLALTLAQAGKKVCLIDADLRKPSVHKVFGLKPSPRQGLPLLLSGQAKATGMLQRGPIPGLWLLPCGVKPPNPSELMGSPRLAVWLAWFKRRFDYVLFDAAPVLPVTDSVALAAQLDGVVLLGRFEQTRRGDMLRSLEQLRGVKARVLGTLLNAVDMKKYSYTYGNKHRYYAYADAATP
jgi:tyrosine-protein kinase Etk/Wzc